MYNFVKEEYKTKEKIFISKNVPILIFNHKGMRTAHVNLPMGAAMAGTVLEVVFALGCDYAIFFGDSGVLTPSIKWGEIIVPTKALRTEGTSYHYEKPSMYTYPSKLILKHIEKTLKVHNVGYHRGGTWTTDAPYRETPRKVKKHFKDGCLAVEMEAAGLFSIAKYRKKHIGAILNAGDCVAGKKWDSRSIWKDFNKEKTKMLRLLSLSLESQNSIHDDL